ncbi:MAG: hypothetical protein IT186_04805 [Acidobacteria bacterium]|nr:hypothetical protein [Acidobacteriota bacterium]
MKGLIASTSARVLVLFSLFAAAAAPTCVAQPATRGGALPLPLFPASNWWSTDVSQAPLDPNSAWFINFIGATKGLHPDFGGDADTFPEIYGMVYITVPGSLALEPVAFDYADESDPGAPGRPAGYPIPPEAKTEPKWIEGGYPGSASAGGDKHMLIVDRDNKLLFETWNTRFNASANRWEAGSGAVIKLGTNDRRPEGWTSADAAGLAVLPGLVRYDEVYGSSPIQHAFRVTVRATNGYVYPASHRAGSTSGALPMGARLRLKAGKDISGFPEPLRRVFQAMKTYGLIVADNGSDMYITGTYDPRWDNDLLNPAFASLKAGDFEVVQLGWQPPSGGGGGPACTAGDYTLCLAGGRFKVEAEYRDYSNNQGKGHAVPLTADSGTFWFFDSANVEVLAKFVNFCASGGNYGFYANGLTDLGVTLTVTDTSNGNIRQHTNPLGRDFLLVKDGSFPCP